MINTDGFGKKNETRYGYCSNIYENKNSDNAKYYYRKNGLRKLNWVCFG
jgi:hypothetical protein